MSDLNEQVLGEFQAIYAELKGGERRVCREDRLTEDLAIDSLLGQELLFRLEERLETEVLGDPRLANVRTVGDMVDAIVAMDVPTGYAAG